MPGAIVFVSQAERCNIGLLVMVELFIWTAGLLLGYVVHVNDRLRVDGLSTGNTLMMGERKWSMRSTLTFLHQQKTVYLFFLASAWFVALLQHWCFSSTPRLQNKIFSTRSVICRQIDRGHHNNVECHDDAFLQWNWSSQASLRQLLDSNIHVAAFHSGGVTAQIHHQASGFLEFFPILWLFYE